MGPTGVLKGAGGVCGENVTRNRLAHKAIRGFRSSGREQILYDLMCETSEDVKGEGSVRVWQSDSLVAVFECDSKTVLCSSDKAFPPLLISLILPFVLLLK